LQLAGQKSAGEPPLLRKRRKLACGVPIELALGTRPPAAGVDALVGNAPVIEARDLAKRYGDTVGVDGIDLVVEAGEVFGFLGPNGAGKTTTIRLLLDLIRPARGEVRVFGRPAHDPSLRARLGYLPGELVLDGRLTGIDPLVRESVFEILTEAGRAGRTVFHSSHVLSEVDRTCTRVAIIGGGRLLGVMRVDDIHRTSVRRMVVRFAREVPLAELALPGVEVVAHEADGVVLRVWGDLDPLIGVLARHSVTHLVFPEPTLEEAFVELYRTNEAGSS
jgi:ABC-type multidrug transport system ATPase subunit